jgi:hypothetical protein
MLKLIKTTFSTLFFTYKNIFHFIASKILIIISSIIIWFLFILPFMLILTVFIYFYPNTDSIIIELFRYFLTIFFVFFAFLNYKLLFINLSSKYTEWKKLKFTKNNYFNFKLIFKFIKISLLIFLWFLLITLVFGILWIILAFVFGWIDSINNIMAINWVNAFSIISLLLFIIYLLIISYFLYRVYFSFYILLENKDLWVIKIIKKSIKKTRKIKKIFKFIIILLLFMMILFPVNYLWQYIDFNHKTLEYYIDLKNKKISKQEITSRENIDYTFLNNEFGKYNNKELVEKYDKSSIIKTIYFVLHFLLIFGIFDLVIANFYKKEIE